MRFVFFGTSEFAVPCLRAIAEHTTLVVTQPGKPSGRGMRLRPSPVESAASSLGLPLFSPLKARDDEAVERIRAESADALIVAAYGQILSTRLLETAKKGGINLHGSILPRYRGAAPIQRAILNGDSITGVTLMQMDKGMDSGDVIDVRTTEIGPDETYGDLGGRLSEIASELIASWATRIAGGDYPRQAQDASQATLAAKIEKSEARLNVHLSIAEEYRRFRAFTPVPGAYLLTRFGLLRIVEARTLDVPSGDFSPGQVVSRSEGLAIAFEGGVLNVIRVRPEGKTDMLGRDFANGARLKPGDSIV